MNPDSSLTIVSTKETFAESSGKKGSRGVVQQLRKLWQAPRLREVVLYCLPALILGVIVRALMMRQMPYGYMQFDSADFLLTAHHWLTRGSLVIHSKRTFLVPMLYCIPFLLKVPALIVIPIAQHLLGLGVILMTGMLTRLWFRPWKWAIVPLTMIMAVLPGLLWYEHALMSESVYLFGVFALALAGTLYAGHGTGKSFGLLLGVLLFTAGARPEGRLLLPFGMLLIILTEWGRWKLLSQRLACFGVFAVGVLAITQTGQAGQLLYATVLPLAPDESKVDPEFGRKVRPLRDEIRKQSVEGMNDELTSLEKTLTDMSLAHLQARGVRNPNTNLFCRNLAIEACLNDPWALPALAVRKFLVATKEPVSVGYEEPRLGEKLEIGFSRKSMLGVLSKGLVGRDLSDRSAVADFVREHYRPFPWYRSLDRTWRRITVGHRPSTASLGGSEIPPPPTFFILSLAGMAIALLFPNSNRRFHAAWILSLGGLWFAVQLTGVVNPRYRYIFEPFCVFYLFLGSVILIEFCASGLRFLTRNPRKDALLAEPMPTPQPSAGVSQRTAESLP